MNDQGRRHKYRTSVEWLGNRGSGTSDHRSYGREHEISAGDKPVIAGSSDPAFRGDPARWNPEDLLVASLSACHKLWYLHLCSVNGICVLKYRDEAVGSMLETADGSGRFTTVVLHPEVLLRAGDDLHLAERLHRDAHAACFIANSVNFEVRHEATIICADVAATPQPVKDAAAGSETA